LRPSEGGKFHPPVGRPISLAVCADQHAIDERTMGPRAHAEHIRYEPGVDWSDVAPAPPKQTCWHCKRGDIHHEAAFCGSCGANLARKAGVDESLRFMDLVVGECFKLVDGAGWVWRKVDADSAALADERGVTEVFFPLGHVERIA